MAKGYYEGQFCCQIHIKFLVAFNNTRFSELGTVPNVDIGILQNRDIGTVGRYAYNHLYDITCVHCAW